MKKIMTGILIAIMAFSLVACATTQSSSQEETYSSSSALEPSLAEESLASQEMVEITDAHGIIAVPINPERVVALDNRTFETLSDWGIELAAVPKGVMPNDSPYVLSEAVLDVGSHNDPNLEIIAAVDPELVIVGQRFSQYYDEIKAIVPNAVVIDLAVDVSGEVSSSGEGLVDGLKNSTLTLGMIFGKNDEAKQLVAEFDSTIAGAKEAYDPTKTVMTLVVSGGEIGFSAPGSGRVWGPMYDIFGWTSALEVDGATSDHQGDDISVEAIAQSNPDWIFVLDRDAAVSSTADAVPAQDVINHSPALQNTTAILEKQIIFAPNDTYTNESIQTYIELFANLEQALVA